MEIPQNIKFREMTSEDINALFTIYSDKEAMKYRGSQPMKDIENAKAYVKNQELREGNVLTIRKGVELVEEKELIGSVMFRFDKNNQHQCEIGYSIGREFWRNGFGNAIVKEILKSLSQNKDVTDVIAWSNIHNIASIKILEKHGFHQNKHDGNQEHGLYKKQIK